MMSYLAQRSQWGSASAGRFGFTPYSATTTLSASLLPIGTVICGALGSEISFSLRVFSVEACSSARAFSSPFSCAVRVLACSASSFFPCFISMPISLAILFCSAFTPSAFTCRARRCSSSFRISAMRSSTFCTFLIFNRAIISSVCSLIYCNCNIFFILKTALSPAPIPFII